MIYLAGAFRTNHNSSQKENVAKAVEWWKRLTDEGHDVLCPHIQSLELDPFGDRGDDFWLGYTMRLMLRCDSVSVIPGWEHSAGTREELRVADKFRMPIRYLEER